MSDSVRCMWMRGGTSKGGYFLAQDLPDDTAARDAFLLAVMGSPDPRQIDGLGGADPLTSKIAIVSKSQNGADVDYLFLQVGVDKALVSDMQNCGNILAGVGPFAIERGLVAVTGDKTDVVIHMLNTGQIATATLQTPNGKICYSGDTAIDGVPGTAALVAIAFQDTAGSSCGALLPTGNAIDVIDGIAVTMIDDGMPCVVIYGADMGITGMETREELEANEPLRARLESVRLQAGPLMNLDDVTDKTVPKMTMVSPPQQGGTISTRTFIPHRCHASIGVLGAVSVATACLIAGTVAADMAVIPAGNAKTLRIEHPIGNAPILATLAPDGTIASAAVIRTARKLFDGEVFA